MTDAPHPLDPSSYKVLPFACYGTLVDWEAGLLAQLMPWAERHALRCTGEELLLRHAEHEPQVQESHPAYRYPQVLEQVFQRIAADYGVDPDPADAAAFGRSVTAWPPFPDSKEALRRLAQRFDLVVLSNVDNDSLGASRELLGDPFRTAVTAEDVGAYKPDRRMFEAALETARELGASRDQVLHVAQSLYHDHVPAAELGLDAVWVDRRGGTGGAARDATLRIAPLATVPDLAGLADLLS